MKQIGNDGAGVPNVKIDLSSSKPLLCSACGYDTFIEGNRFRKISKFVTGTPQDVLIPVGVFMCGGCGVVCEELIPEQLKALDK